MTYKYRATWQQKDLMEFALSHTVRYRDPLNKKRFAIPYKDAQKARDKMAQLKRDGVKEIEITQDILRGKFKEAVAENLRYSVKFSYSKGGKIANAFYQDKAEAEKFVKSVIAKGGKAIMTTEEVKEDAPANAVGDGSNLAMPPSHEPGVHVKKKKKELTSLLRREDYDKVEVENLINKIETNQEIEENQIKPILNNIKSKKEKGTYTEDFGMTAFRYVVDNQITSTVSENFRNRVASELLSKYV